MRHQGVVTSGRVTHATGSVDDIGAASPESERDGVAALLSRPAVEEALVLHTCNRLEAYVVTPEPAAGREAVDAFFDAADPATVRRADHEGSLRHLLRVAAGLESVVVGEDQILGQLRTAAEEARALGALGSLLDPAVTKALHVGERARTQTAINDGAVSLGSAAVSLLAEERALAGASALVVGAGEMGRVVARSLASAGVGEVTVANRTVSRAAAIVRDLETPASAIGLSELGPAVERADVVVTATASDEPLLTQGEVWGDPLIVDLGQPRDVSPELSGATVYDLDDLESVTEATRERRAAAARTVESLVDRELSTLLEHLKRTRADGVIAAMYESAERIKRREVETAIARLEEGDAADAEVVRSMADALVNQLLAPPTRSLRSAASEDDWDTINTALQLFDPELSADDDRQRGAVDPAVGTAEDD